MILDVIISDRQSNWSIPKSPMGESVSANGKSLMVIYNYLRLVDDKRWLDRATKEASGEMISDVDEVVREAKAVIRAARKSIPWHHRYFLTPIKLWLQKLK